MKKETPGPGIHEEKIFDFSTSLSEKGTKRVLGSRPFTEDIVKLDDLSLVSIPDLAIQFQPSLQNAHFPQLQDPIISALKQAYGTNTDVRYIDSSNTNTGKLGIWFQLPMSAADNQARQAGLQGLSIIKPGETFALYINATYLKIKVNDSWNNMPKVYNSNMVADPKGPTHLTSISFTIQSPNSVITTVKGFDERPWPDVDFTLTIQDVLSASSNNVTATTSSKLDVDKSWLNLLTGVFLFALSPLALVFLTENIIVRMNESTSYNSGGVGMQAASLIPKEIMIPANLKLVFMYSRSEVNSGSLVFGGEYLIAARTPGVYATGAYQLSTNSFSTSITQRYKAVTVDLRGNLQYAWKVDGSYSGNTQSADIKFTFVKLYTGQSIIKKLTLSVTDADGLTATYEHDVEIFNPSDDKKLPPICRVQPWLPQCRISQK